MPPRVHFGWVVDGEAWRMAVHPFQSAEERDRFVEAVDNILRAQTLDADAERAQSARAEGRDYGGDTPVPEPELMAAYLASQSWGWSESDRERGFALLYDAVGENDSLSQLAEQWDLGEHWLPAPPPREGDPEPTKHEIDAGFPFRLLAFMGEDGQPVIEIETGTTRGEKYHDVRGEPYVRVWVNDGLASEYAGRVPWPRARRELARLAGLMAGARPPGRER